MAVLESHVDRASPAYRENRAAFEPLVAELQDRLAQVRQGGGAQAIERHRARNKLLARERIERLCDPDTPFLELSPLAAWGSDFTVGASVVCGIGAVEGVECVRARRADGHLEPLLAEHVRDRVAERFFVLDHEHACH